MENFFKTKIPRNLKTKGFLVVEILVAISIISISILSAMAVSQKSISLSQQAFHAAQASFLLEEGAEAVRISRDNAWSNISSLTAEEDYYPTFASNTWTLSPTPNTIGMFTRTVTISNVNRDSSSNDISDNGTDDPGTKLVTVTVSWNERGTLMTKTLQFYVMDIFS